MPILKYCGVQTEQDYKLVLGSKADYIGFIFFDKSKRFVKSEEVRQWTEKFGRADKKLVGVFVNEPIDNILTIASRVPLDVIQLHGNEQLNDINYLRSKTNIAVWKAIAHDEQTSENINKYRQAIDAFLIDSKVQGQFGGTGKVFDWGFIPIYQELASKINKPCIIAGGLSAENIQELLKYRIDGLDISSGIEDNGRKNERKIKQLEREIFHDISGSR